jgi:hypothetical protein
MNRTIRGVDYSFDRANLAELKRLGYRFVIRYLTGSGKALTRGRAQGPRSARPRGRRRVRDDGRAGGGGHAAGQHDAQVANAAAANVGLAGIPIYMAVDDDLTFDTVRPYFEGASPVLGKGKRGAYASGLVLRQLMHAGLIDFAWEAGARGVGRRPALRGRPHPAGPGRPRRVASVDVNHAPEAVRVVPRRHDQAAEAAQVRLPRAQVRRHGRRRARVPARSSRSAARRSSPRTASTASRPRRPSTTRCGSSAGPTRRSRRATSPLDRQARPQGPEGPEDPSAVLQGPREAEEEEVNAPAPAPQMPGSLVLSNTALAVFGFVLTAIAVVQQYLVDASPGVHTAIVLS